MAHEKRLRDGLATGALALLLVVGGLTACSAGDPPGAGGSPVASDIGTSASDSPSPAPVVLGAYVGESSDQASAELTDHGLLVSFSDPTGMTLPSEQGWSVTGQHPEAGSSVAPGSMVQLIVTPPVVAANHVGETSDQAAAELTQQGLSVSFTDTAGDVIPSEQGWSVVGQSPPAGASLRSGSTVRLILSPPPPPAPAPAPPADSGSGASSGSEQAVPAGGPTAKCNDGTLSYSAHHQGTCSHHGGVAVWYK